jgi:hypothetical protein
MAARAQSSTTYPIAFLMVSNVDHVTPVTGAAPTVTVSKNGGAFGAAAGAVTEIGNGWYALTGNAGDRNTLGELLIHATATGADPVDMKLDVVTTDPYDVNLGLPALDTLGAADVTVVNPVAASGAVTVVRGDDYATAEARRLSWTGATWPDITGATIALGIRATTGWTTSIAGVVVSSTQAAVALTAAQTALFPLGGHLFDVQATLPNGHVVTLVRGSFAVLEDYA